MDAVKYQTIKDQTYKKIQERLKVTPSIQEELTAKFTEWFQGLIQAGKAAAQEALQQAQQQSGG